MWSISSGICSGGFHVTEELLYTKKEITTPVDTLSWDYYKYVKNNHVAGWSDPSYILYSGKDDLQSLQVVKAFAKLNNAVLTVS